MKLNSQQKFDVSTIKKDFPIFAKHKELIFLDSAATSQKPQVVIDAVANFYENYNSNVHRGIYTLGEKATQLYENTRQKVASFIGALDPSEIIFTGNASEAINLAAFGYAGRYLKSGDIVVLSEMEHHSNLVPWLRLKEKKGVRLFFLPIDQNFRLDYKSVVGAKLPKNKIKLVALTQASNVLGTINPIAEIVQFLKQNSVYAKILVDAAQSVPHLPISVKNLACDFLAFSSHKMLGPTGVGVLWAKKELLEGMEPLFVGSHMVSSVTKNKAVWAQIPDKLEVGTGRLEAVIGLGAAIDYLQKIGPRAILNYEKMLTQYALGTLGKISNLDLYGSKEAEGRLGVFSFNLKGIHSHDVAEILNRDQICVRAGHHCAQPLMKALGVSGTVRASLYFYNTKKDLDRLFDGIEKVKKIFKVK